MNRATITALLTELEEARTVGAVRSLIKQFMVAHTPTPEQSVRAERYRQAARERYEHEGEVEIDDDAPVSFGEDHGAYVQCWRWVDGQDAGEPDPDGDDDETRMEAR